MRNIFFDEKFGNSHNFGNSGFVVSAENSSTVCGDQSPAFQGGKMGEHLRGKCASACSKSKLSSVVIFGNHRICRMAAEIGNSVHVCNETEFWRLLISRCSRKMCIDITKLVNIGICDSKLF